MRSCLIADDHGLVRDALASTVARRWPGARVDQAADFDTAWASVAADPPQIALIDLEMPGAEPLDGIDGLRVRAPAMLIVVVTGSCDDAMMLALLERGIAGFVEKTMSADVILAAVGLVLAGGRYLPARLADLHLPRLAPAVVADAGRALSGRQVEVVRLMAQGLSNKDIARELAVSPATVKTHVAQIIATTGALNRTDAVVRAKARHLF